MEKSIIELDNGDVVGYFIDLDNAPLLLIKARKGYVFSTMENTQRIRRIKRYLL